MRDNLLGYLLEALEPHERDAVEQSLERDPRLRAELELLDRGLEPLRADRGHLEAPHGLAQRTCDFVITQATVMLAPAAAPSRMRWTMADFVVAAGIVIAASMMFFPALNHSRHLAQMAGCQNNMRQVGVALAGFSQNHGGSLPEVLHRGKIMVPESFASTLAGGHYLPSMSALRCPAGGQPAEGSDAIPTVVQIQTARGSEWTRIRRWMDRVYAYTLGYYEDGEYRTPKHVGDSHFVILSDAPNYNCSSRMSQSHGGGIQNVMFRDLHVKQSCSCKPEGGRDDIFLNGRNQIAPGTDPNDSVVATSRAEPLLIGLEQ